MALCLTVHEGDVLRIGDAVVLFTKSRGMMRVIVEAPKHIEILREKAKNREPKEREREPSAIIVKRGP